jgi:hypothetical protein
MLARNRQVDERDGFITVDVTASYPQKELALQDFMDVEYVALETGGEFYTQALVQAIGKNIIIVTNAVDGNIFIFDRNGKGLRKINRMGQGPEEYRFASSITLDEENNEMFVNDFRSTKIVVYDLYGKYKRSFRHREKTYYLRITNFDKDHLMCFQEFYPGLDEESNRNSFFIVSKQDGSIREVKFPFKKKISATVSAQQENRTFIRGPRNNPLVPFENNWVITEASTDTVYRYLTENSKRPFIVRTPSVQSMEPVVFLFPGILTDSYYFMQTVKMEYDFQSSTGFPRTDLMYDRQVKKLFRTTLLNSDYKVKKTVEMHRLNSSNDAFWLKIEADELFEDYEKGVLKDKLKEIAAKLKEEDNPVIMLVKHKK